MSLKNLVFEECVYVECQECEDRIEGMDKTEVRQLLKKEGWLTQRWVPKGYDTEFDLLCPDCVELYKEEP